MGHIIFLFLHLLAIIFSFFGLFITIPLHLIYCAASKPKTLRADGKIRNGGLFGSAIDACVVNYKMTDCPYCKGKIMKTATKCMHCHEFLDPEKEEAVSDQSNSTPANPKSGSNIAVIIFFLLCSLFFFTLGFVVFFEETFFGSLPCFIVGILLFGALMRLIKDNQEAADKKIQHQHKKGISTAGVLFGAILFVVVMALTMIAQSVAEKKEIEKSRSDFVNFIKEIKPVRHEEKYRTFNEPTKAVSSPYNHNFLNATTSQNLTKADLAWHALNTYGWDCEEVVSKGNMTTDGYFCIECSSGLELRVYPRQDAHPRITNKNGGYK